MLEGQSPAPSTAARRLTAKDAIAYLDFIKAEFDEATYDAFLDIMKAYKNSESVYDCITLLRILHNNRL